MAGTLQGKSYTWQVSEDPIGSGDAGEVFTAACIEQPGLTGVLKKPARIATSGTIQRQAGQITQEGLALARLEGLPQCKANPPLLLDTAPDFTRGTANYFIVSESAPGNDIAAMLADSRQSEKPFPRRVIISVLDSLFDLFARAHRTGVLWNDVKLDHIYWHNPSGKVAVIDWGNAVFLDEEPHQRQHTLPRWEDYRQLVESLGSFLQQSAPELFADLGWDEFQGADLDSARISILARRIAYQQQVIALRVMEFQSLIRVVLKNDPSVAGLEKIQSYQEVLLQIGAPWDADAVLDYSRTLVLRLLSDGDTQSGVKAAALVWDIFGTSLDLPWHMLREYFRYPDLISHPRLPDLANHTLHEYWSVALWTLITIAQEFQPSDWWDRLMPVLRQKAVRSAAPPPYQASQTLLVWIESQGDEWQAQAESLQATLDNWHTEGRDLNKSPFDYAVLDFVRSEHDIPLRIRAGLKQSFAAGEGAIRELFQTWANMSWDALPKAFRRVAGWDPDRWGITHLAQAVTDFQSWLEILYNGPDPESPVEKFLQDLISVRPAIEGLLGAPAWLSTLLHMLDTVQQGAPISKHGAEVKAWCPWLLKYPDIHTAENEQPSTEEAVVCEVLTHFASHLRNWSDIDAALEVVKDRAPEYYPASRELVNRFNQVFSLNPNVETPAPSRIDTHPMLDESHTVLQKLSAWRQEMDNGNLKSALNGLSEIQGEGWLIVTHTHERTEFWIKEVDPLLRSLASLQSCQNQIETVDEESALIPLADSCTELRQYWENIYSAGLHLQLLELFEDSIESIRNTFFGWRDSVEHSDDRVDSLIAHSQMKLIRLVSDRLVNLSEQSRQARLNFVALGQRDEVAQPVQIQKASNLLYHLSKIEEMLIPENERRFPNWIKDFQAVTEAEITQEQHDIAIALPEDHPLFTWLVESSFAR